MSNQIGLIKDSIGDRRAGKLVFLSHWMLNQNACVRGLASQPAVIREIVDLALDNDVAIYQMPCPEVSYLGSMRWAWSSGCMATRCSGAIAAASRSRFAIRSRLIATTATR